MNLDTELEALDRNLRANTSIVYITDKQVHGINALLRMGLDDSSPETRHAVLNLIAGKAMYDITGVQVQSAKNLTSPAASFLINLFLEENSTPWRLSAYGREFLRLAETKAKAQVIH